MPTKQQIIEKANELRHFSKIPGVKIIPRVKNYRAGDEAHNQAQPLASIQFDFKKVEDRDAFKLALGLPDIMERVIVYEGLGWSNQPVLQLSADFVAAFSRPVELLVHDIEQQVGKFSRYRTVAGEGENIPFDDKPAQQFLTGLGVTRAKEAALSSRAEGPLAREGNPLVTVKGFVSGSADNLEISGRRVDRLVNSAKVYVNTDIFPVGQYVAAVTGGRIRAQENGVSPSTGIHWQNMAVGVCHVQEIDLLVDQSIDSEGNAISAPRKGIIDENAPAMLLLSAPALNFRDHAGKLTTTQQEQFVAGMFRNLFRATLAEGRHYIALPAAGLGVFEGDPNIYFAQLMKVAQEFPSLNIIYNPVRFSTQFDEHLAQAKPKNVVKTQKDVVFIADQLTKNGYPCALHNPSDCDVVFGVYDPGEHWKTGKGDGYVGEEHIGAMSTAPMNGRMLNPVAYNTVIEHGAVAAVSTLARDTTASATAQTIPPTPPAEAEQPALSTKQPALSTKPALSTSEPALSTNKPALSAKSFMNEVAMTELIMNKLLPLTQTYLTYLKETSSGLKGPELEKIEDKIRRVTELEKILGAPDVPEASKRVKNFYIQLDADEQVLRKHRDLPWKHYVKSIAIAASFLVAGLGLIALAVYVNVGKDSDTKSFRFWQSRGKTVVKELNESNPDKSNSDESSDEGPPNPKG